jgi:uncharacterized glyoxalase superfamily protein PhnB
MITNRSVPTDTVLPHITYSAIPAAIAWLTRVFGFTEHYRYGEPAQGGQMTLGRAVVMLSIARPGRSTPAAAGVATQFVSVFVDDVDAHYARTRAEGAAIVEELNETMYGERQYVARDLEGHSWLFATHARDLHPSEWGAAVNPNWR